MNTKDEFLKAYNISKDDFNKTNLKWEDLKKIYDQYSKSKGSFEQTAKDIAERLRMNSKVHSVKFRVKEPEHLIAKIIRKKIENPQDEITIENYANKITDIVGVRALHLFKSDWIEIHSYINKGWNQTEPPTANIRKGDLEEEYKENKCEIKEHKFGYRSVHYLIESKPMKEVTICEIQVRTIFEEGWSEIDHEIRYPYNTNNVVLSAYLGVFNRYAGSADEMGTFLKELQKELDAKEKKIDESEKKIKELKSLIESSKIDKETKKKLELGIDELRLGASGINYSTHGLGNKSLHGFVIDPMLTTASPFYLTKPEKQCVICGENFVPDNPFSYQDKCEKHKNTFTAYMAQRCSVCNELFTPDITSLFPNRCRKHQNNMI